MYRNPTGKCVGFRYMNGRKVTYTEGTEKMKKKKTLRYAVMAILILTVGILMQYGIRWTTGFFSGQIREKFSRPPETEPVTAPEEEGRVALTLAAETEEDRSSIPGSMAAAPGGNELTVTPGEEASEDSHAAETRSTLEGLTAYHNANTPEVTGNESDLQAFVGDRNQSFVNAVLNFLYAYYRDMYRVKEIHLLEKVEEKDGVLVYQMELFLAQGQNEGYTVFLCSYDTNEDVYTVYTTRDATGGERLG